MATSLSTNGRKKISTFKTEFSIKFPYLTIQFLDSKRKEFDQDLNLATVRSKKGNDISISGQNKINSLESKFEKTLGIAIEVCYSKNDKLIRTKSNNDKTLSELNRWCEANGCDLISKSKQFNSKKDNKSDDSIDIDELIKQLEAEQPGVDSDDQKEPSINKKKLKENQDSEVISLSTSMAEEENSTFYLYGFLNKAGKEIILCKYDEVGIFSDGLASVKKNGLWGYIDKKGKVAVPLEYDGIGVFSEGLAGVKKADLIGFIDKNGNVVVPHKYDQAGVFSDGLALVKKDGLWGYIDKKGNEIVPLKYDEVGIFSDGLASVKKNGLWGYIDKKGKVAVPLEYDGIGVFSEGLAGVKKADLIGFIDKNGNVVVPHKYDEVGVFSEGLAGVKKADLFGFINKNGKEVVPIKYEGIGVFSEGLARVKKNGLFGLIDNNGKEVTPIKYDEIDTYYDGLAYVGKGGLWGFIDKNGKEMVPPKYDGTGVFSEGLAGVFLDGLAGFIDKSGKEVVPLKYDAVDAFSEGLAGVKKDDLYGFIDKNGKEVVPLKYDEAGLFSEGLASVGIISRVDDSDSSNDDLELEQIIKSLEAELHSEGEEESNLLPQNALDLVACVYILKYYYLSLNQDKKCSDNFDDEFSKLFVIENFSNDKNLIIKEIKEHFKNNTIDELITSGIAKADSLYDKKYETHNDFLIDLCYYISYFDLLDDSVFQSKFLSANIEIGNKLSEIANSGDQIKPQDRYLVIQIALMNWYNIKNEGFDINKVLKKVKFNLTAGSLLKYATREEDLTLMEKAALAVYNIILLDEDGLEIKNKDIFRAKLLIANFFNFEKKSEGVNVATMLKGSLNNSGKDDLSALIGGFEDNYCFDVMQFFNCTFAISKFRNRCIDLFKDSYKEINETYGGYIEDAIEDAQFDAEDAREEKIVSLYHDAINEDKEEDE